MHSPTKCKQIPFTTWINLSLSELHSKILSLLLELCFQTGKAILTILYSFATGLLSHLFVPEAFSHGLEGFLGRKGGAKGVSIFFSLGDLQNDDSNLALLGAFPTE